MSFTSLSPTFSFSLSFSIFQICEHENKSKLNTLDNTDIETIFAFLFVFIDSLIVSASQDAGGHAISRQKNPRSAFGLSYLLIESFYIVMSVVQTDVRLRDYKSQPKFLGYIRQPNLLTHGAPLIWKRRYFKEPTNQIEFKHAFVVSGPLVALKTGFTLKLYKHEKTKT